MKTLARIGFLRENSRGMGAKCPKEKCRCNSSIGHLVKFNQGSGGIQRFSKPQARRYRDHLSIVFCSDGS